MAVWPRDLEATMRWLRANGITHEASEIVDNVQVEEGQICYEVVYPQLGGPPVRVRHRTPLRVTFQEANPR